MPLHIPHACPTLIIHDTPKTHTTHGVPLLPNPPIHFQSSRCCSIEKAQHLASQLLPACLLMAHDAHRCCQNHHTKLYKGGGEYSEGVFMWCCVMACVMARHIMACVYHPSCWRPSQQPSQLVLMISHPPIPNEKEANVTPNPQ